jgi:transposase
MEGRRESDPERIAAIMIGFPDAHVLSVDEDEAGLWVGVETADGVAQCGSCGALAALGETHLVEREGLPVFGRALHLSWRAREWRCPNAQCPTGSWVEQIPETARSPRVNGG